MPQQVSSITLKAKWKIDDSKIYHANAFNFFFTPYLCSLYVGFINPEDLLSSPQQDKTEKITTINLLGRYSLDMEAFKRLKNEVDKTHKLLEEMGVLKNE